MLVDSPYFPDELEALPGPAGRRRLRARRAARHPRGLRPPARPARLPRARARARRAERDAHPPGARRGAARAPRQGRRAVRGASRAACAGRGPDAARAGQRRARLGGARAAPRRGPHLRRNGGGGALVRAPVRGRLPLEGRDSRWSSPASATIAPRWRGSHRSWRRRRRSCPATAAPNARDEALRILDEDVDYLDALERGEEKPRLPKGRDSREQRKIHAENLARV